MANPDLNKIFDIPSLPDQHRLSIIYRRMMEKRYELKSVVPENLPWNGDFFGLTQTTLYNRLDPIQKKSLVQLLNERLFASFLYVEKSGLTFGARMILASETLEEKCLYAAFVEEESRHYMEFNRLANLTLEKERHWLPMLDILGSSIEQAEKETMVYIIHVLLEGFSITHYKNLSMGCQDPSLKESFARILEDEGRHHAMGYTDKGKDVSPLVRDQIFEYTRKFLHNMKNSNPIVSAYQILFGELSLAELQALKSETKAEIRGTQRSLVFEGILKRNDYYDLFQRLKAEKVF